MSTTKTAPKEEPFYGDDHFVLNFVSPRMGGLKIELEGLSVQEAYDAEDILWRPIVTRDDARTQFEDLAAFMAPRLVSWNWNDAKTKRPVPMTPAGILSRDRQRVSHIFRTWLDEMSQVNIPLGDGSTSGPVVDMTQIPMDISPDPES